MSDSTVTSPSDIVQERLSLYHGPFVKIRIKYLEVEYTVSKPLLCKASAYFAAMLEGGFIESKEQVISFEQLDGVVSKRSVEGLLQWVYHGKVHFDIEEHADQVSAAIELARLADMCNISDLEAQMAECIKAVLISDPMPLSRPDKMTRRIKVRERDTHAITSQHIFSAKYLPQGHAVRRIIATASVEGFFRWKDYKFAREARQCPTFAADLLEEVGLALDNLEYAEEDSVKVKNPITGEEFAIDRRYS